MTVADRIKRLREKRELTQLELAQRMGYKTKSAVSQLEASGDKITLKTVTRAANALGVPEAYLMGWYDDEEDNNPIDTSTYSDLSPNEQIIIERYRSVPDDRKSDFLGRILAYSETLMKGGNT